MTTIFAANDFSKIARFGGIEGAFQLLTTSVTLASHPDYLITFHQAGARRSKVCLVTFGGQPSDLTPSGFGTEFAAKNGWDSIYVAQRYGTQYQGLSIDAFKAAVAPIIRRRNVVCYGPSLGGYAAFYYGGSINARIIGGAPMFPAWPAFANKAYAGLQISHEDLAAVPKSSKSPVAIFDPTLPRDLRMVEEMLLPAYPNLRQVRYDGSGHSVLITLQQSRQLKPLILSLIRDDAVIPIEPLKEGDPIYHRTRGRLLRQSNPVAAITELRRSLELEPSRQTLAILLSILGRL
ncbi:hypothetical protein [Paracoccus pacificus]|uniref:Alpha/beta hydrolase n=1 Tax=Paracoccus pacificus TaxID=1463598 RepID=A0ABW4RBM2_9RHOB